MRSILVFMLITASLFSCGGDSSLPTGVLPEEKMRAVLWDLLRAEQFVTNYVALKDTTRAGQAKGPQLYDAILKKHRLTDSAFLVSLDYYQKHPKLLNPILDSIGQQPALAPTPMVVTSKDTTPIVSNPPQSTEAATVSPTPKTNSSRPSFAPKPMAY